MFSVEKLERLTSVQFDRLYIQDPCKLAIAAIPDDSLGNDIKFNLYCKSGQSLSVMSLKPLSNYDFGSIVSVMASINFFDGRLLLDNEKQWKCTSNGELLLSNSIIKPLDTINCYEI